MQRSWRETLVGSTWALALLTIGCQLLTGASERHLIPDSGGGASGATAFGGASGNAGSASSGGALGDGGSAGSGGALGSAGSAGSGSVSDAGGDVDDGGSNPDVITSSCAAGYADWFQSSFAVAKRDVVGSADFPTMPWATLGNLTILNGRLSGNGIASASQGLAFPYDGTRLRYKVRFTDSSQRVKVALNAQEDETGGLQIDVTATGNIVLLENDVKRGSADLNPLALDRDWFVEVELSASQATVRLSDTNYAGQAGSSVLATIEKAPLADTASGKRLTIALTGPGDLPLALDELSVARCALNPPKYRPIFKDAFERDDSSVLGNAEVPPTSTWSSLGSDVSIARGGLYFSGSTGSTAIGPILYELMNDAVRLRFAFRSYSDAPEVSLLFVYSYYGLAQPPTFSIATSDATSTSIAFGDSRRTYQQLAIATYTSYYAQIDLQGSNAVLTLRTEGYDGPILVIQAGRLPKISNVAHDIAVASKLDVMIEEIEVAHYAP